MERALLNRSKGFSTQRLHVIQDKFEIKRSSQNAVHQKAVSATRAVSMEDKENVNPDTFELAQQESRHLRQWLPQSQYSHEGTKSFEEISTPKERKGRQPLRDITPVFQKVSKKTLQVGVSATGASAQASTGLRNMR